MPKTQREDVEQAGDDHQRQEARHDQVLDRVDAEHLQRVELLADLAGAEVGGDRGAGDAGDDDGGDERARTRGSTASTKKPPSRSSAPKRVRKLADHRAGRAGRARPRSARARPTSPTSPRSDRLRPVLPFSVGS